MLAVCNSKSPCIPCLFLDLYLKRSLNTKYILLECLTLRLQGFYLLFLYLLLISGSYIAEHFYSVLMLNSEKHYKALGKDKLSYYRNVLYTGYIHWQKDVPSHNSSTTKIKSSKLAIRILFVTIVIRIYVLAWSCKKKDRNLGASGRKVARSFSSKLIWIIKHNMNDFYLMMQLNDFNTKFWWESIYTVCFLLIVIVSRFISKNSY